MNTAFSILVNLIKAKWVFKKPEQKKYLIYDSANSEILFKYIKKKNCEIYHIRWEVINFYIVYKTLTEYGFKNIKENYRKVYINFVHPKIVITLNNVNFAFYKLKYLFPNVITIAIQNTIKVKMILLFLKKIMKNFIVIIYFVSPKHMVISTKNS